MNIDQDNKGNISQGNSRGALDGRLGSTQSVHAEFRQDRKRRILQWDVEEGVFQPLAARPSLPSLKAMAGIGGISLAEIAKLMDRSVNYARTYKKRLSGQGIITEVSTLEV